MGRGRSRSRHLCLPAALVMMRRLLMAILACLAGAAWGQADGFHALSFESGKDPLFEQYSLRLADPDTQQNPTLWQGPLTISNGSVSCTADVSLVSAVYAGAGRRFVIVLSSSGSNAIAHFIDLASCASRWPPVKLAASTARVAGNRLSFFPACEGGGKNAPALCTAARVYRVQNDAPPAYLRSESYRLTAKELGVGFVGEAKILDPRTPQALIVH